MGYDLIFDSKRLTSVFFVMCLLCIDLKYTPICFYFFLISCVYNIYILIQLAGLKDYFLEKDMLLYII